MLNIGLTGGIGAGKSTVSRTLASLGAVIIDGDLIAREVVEPGTPGLAALVDTFGDSILAEDGSLDRPALGAIAFGDEQSRLALNAIVHPLVGERRQQLLDEAAEDSIVVQDIPLLVESGGAAYFALVMVVHVEMDERIRRLVEIRGMTESDARARVRAQATDEQRRAAADVWLDNSGTEDELQAMVTELWNERLTPFADNANHRRVARVLPRIVNSQVGWTTDATRLIARLSAASGGTAMRIDHIGSTAIEGLPAKDVVDIQVSVRDLDAADSLVEPFAAIGFPRVEHITADDPQPPHGIAGEADPVVWQKRLHGSADPGRPANIHIRVDGWPGQVFALAFRDWLTADADARQEYSAIKRRAEAAAAGIDDYDRAIEQYLAVKSAWWNSAYARVWQWITDAGWSVGSGVD